MDVNEYYNRLLAEKAIEEFKGRNIEGWYFEDRASALEKALSLIPEGGTVSCGGSETFQEVGLRDALKEGRYEFYDPLDGKGGAAMDAIARKALGADCYFTGANAISATGEIVNIDGYGNRTAAIIYGPKRVVVIAGMNKVSDSLESAIARARGIAAAKAVAIFKQDFKSYDELKAAAETAQSHIVITKRSALPGRIFLLLVGETLGF